ncbi:outer membrane protein OmpK [Pseudomonas aeruginosa]|nr:outer membrane protein OmpK [Pseudomonas aeruginosa]
MAFQGFFDYEFGSKLPDKDDAFEREYRTDNGFQAYLGLWYHTEHWKFGYGAKVYRNMTQWRDGEQLDGRRTDSSGIGHYFNVGYAF